MQVPSQPYYTVPASLVSTPDIVNIDDPGTRLNILFTKEADFSPDLFAMLSALNSEFMVSIAASLFQGNSIAPGLLAKIYLALVINNFSERQKLVPVFGAAKQNGVSFQVEQMDTYLKQQGCPDTKFPVFSCLTPGIQTVDACSLVVIPEQSNGLDTLFTGNDKKGTTVIIATPHEKTEISAMVDLKNRMNAVYRTTDISPFYISKEEYEAERKLWKQRALLYQDFLSLSKKVQEKEFYDVLNWYHKEYEVLPLWYKRFGHIIKVMIGKRRFRSLFSDNAKKEKE